MELVTVATRAVTGARVARVEPECDAIGATRPARISLRKLFLALHFHLDTQAGLVPGQAHVREVGPLVGGREVVQPAGIAQLEQAILLGVRNALDVGTRVSYADQEARGD